MTLFEIAGGGWSLAQTSVWEGTSSDDYSDATNWNPQSVPNGVGTQAELAASANGTVTLSASVATGGWSFDPNASSFTISGSTVDFGSTGRLLDDATNGQLVSTGITGGGVTLAGAGALELTGANTYAGSTVLSAGTFLVGTDSVLANGAIQSSSAGTGTVDLEGGTLEGFSPSNPNASRLLANAITVGTSGSKITANITNFALTGNITNADASHNEPGSGGPLTFTANGDTNVVVVLSGVNTYTGATIVSGLLEVQAGSTTAFSAASPFVVDSALDLNGYDNTIGALSGSANAQVTLGGATLSIAGVLVDATGTSPGPNAANFAGTIYGPGQVAVTGVTVNGTYIGGAVGLSGANQYAGGTTIAGGSEIVVGNDSALGTGAVTMRPGGAGLVFNDDNAYTLANDFLVSTGSTFTASTPTLVQTISGTIADADPATPGQVIKQGDGILVLTGANTYSGGTVLSAGTLRLGGAGTTGVSGAVVSSAIGKGPLVFDGGTLQSSNPSYTVANAVAVNGTGGTIDTDRGNVIAVTGAIGNGTATTGTLTIANSGPASGAVILSGANTYSGPTVVAGATGTSAAAVLRAGSVTGFSAQSAFTVDGTLDLDGYSNTIAALSGSGQVTNAGAATATLTIANTTGSPAAFSGAVTDGPTQRTALAVTHGTQYLAGANTYAGGTTIGADGALVLGVGGTSGSIAGDVANSGVLAFDRSDDVTFDGRISGSGAVYQIGGGTTTLTADDTYTGGTAILGGALLLGNGGTTGAIVGAVANSGILAFDRSDDVTFDGPISGSGAVYQIGGGTTTLTADNTYTGGTEILAGALLLGNGGTTGAIVGAVANNGVLGFDRSDDVTFGGRISGSGAVYQLGSGVTTLTADNTYTGGTAILGGALLLGNGGTTGAIVGDVANNGVLGFDRSDDVTFHGSISGSGAVYQLGSGTTVLTADNTYTGGTAILGGALQLGNGGTTGSVTGTIEDHSLLVFDRADTVSFAGAISGGGDVVQAGSGTLVLTGDSSYTGTTVVAAGTLTVNGFIVSPTEVEAGATLNGSGVVGAVTVGDGGTLGAGTASTIGLLYVDGNLTFRSGSNDAVKIVSANQNDIVLTSGQANLAGGTVRLLASGAGFAVDTRYLILNARAGIVSPFAGVTSNFAFLRPTLLYDANNVYVDVGNPLFTNPGNLNPTQAAVAQALESGYAATGNASSGLLAAAATLSTSQAPAALAQLSGQATSATQEVSFAAGKLFVSAMNDQTQSWLRGTSTANEIVLQAKPLAYAATEAGPAGGPLAAFDAPAVAPTRTWRAWGTGYGDAVSLRGLDDGGLLDLEHHTAGGAFGADYQINPQLLAGFGVGGSTSSFSVPNSLTSGSLDAGHLGVYAAGRIADFYTTAALSYAHAENATTRSITDLGTPATEHGAFGSDQFAASFEAGYRYDTGVYAVTPFASVAFYDTFQNAYTEKGGGPYGLSFGSRQASAVPVAAGAQIDGRFTLANGMVLEPYLRAAYSHEVTRQRSIDAFFTDVPLSFFTASGIVADADVADIKAGAHLYVTPAASLFASFEAVASPRTQGYAGMAGFTMLIGGSDARPSPQTADVPVTPWTVSVTPDLRIDSFRASRGYPAVSGPHRGSGFQLYASDVIQAAGTILPDLQLNLLAKPGVLYGHQGSAGLVGSVATPADTTASATFTYLGIDGVQPFLSLNFNLPSGDTVLKGSAANARLDPDFVTVGTYGEGFNIGPTLGVNLPFSQELTASFSVGYTHHGAYDKEGPIDPFTFAQGTQVFAPGQDLTLSGNVGYVSGAFNTQASLSFALSGITYTDGTPTYESGDRTIGSVTEAYTWDPTDITTFTGTLIYTDRNNILNTSLPAFVAESFDSNNFVTRLRLTHSFIKDKWTYGPLLGLVIRDRNGYDVESAQFVPAKTIYSGGVSAAYAFDDTTSITASVEYFHSNEFKNPATAVGRVVADGLHVGLTGAYTF